MFKSRNYSFFDQICLGVDQALRAVFGTSQATGREYPGKTETDTALTAKQRQHSAGIMRVNHTGEVCAQALYHAQGISSRSTDIKAKMQKAAMEEGDHLAWCHTRLLELGSHTSYLNPLWYAGSFAMGLTAGLIGDKWSLGFLAETEHQVVQHLQNQMQLLPQQDNRSYKILQQMQHDEAEHRDDALLAGAESLPEPIKKLMQFTSKIMVTIAYKI